MKNIYLCGPTVYNTPHIGNMRPILTFDIYIRALNKLGIKTNLIHNITDIDDKIIAKSIEEGVEESIISERYLEEYRELLVNYNIQTIDSMPKVTDNIESIVAFIEKLVNNGSAYTTDSGVYFSVDKDSKYGTLSNRDLESMRFEESNKKHPGDFAIWKFTDTGIQFDSPWGKGRPGWHTECAVFVNDDLDSESLDLHGGGIDLVFPHHENEASQYRAINNKEITKEWKHIGHLSVEGEKMSKSLGNTLSAIQFADEVDPDVLRMLFLTSNETGPINLTDELLEQLKDQTKRWTSIYNKAQLSEKAEADISEILEAIANWKFAEANKLINEEVKIFNKKEKNNSANIIEIMQALGFNFSKNILSKGVIKLYKEWLEAKENKEFEKADSIREILNENGLI